MADIISFQNYKLQRQSRLKLPKTGEQNLANQILNSFSYNNLHREIPIVRIAKSYGISIFRENFDQKEKTNIAGKLYIGETTKEKYGCDKVILVNSTDHIFDQRVVVAKMLGCYLIEKPKENRIITNNEVYEKYKEFVLNILAPSKVFIEQHNLAIGKVPLHMFVYSYLEEFFKVPEEFIDQKIKSLR